MNEVRRRLFSSRLVPCCLIPAWGRRDKALPLLPTRENEVSPLLPARVNEAPPLLPVRENEAPPLLPVRENEASFSREARRCSMDISSDLIELGKTSVAVISAGVKSILDIPRTLQYLV
ncbi:hypothetical protein BHE74_00025391 [Ensete ventricosum]|nr:hypothetical protein BHE74_00025391 [Ensete ventricosum]